MMAAIAGKLTDEEIGALANYVQGLHPRADEVAVGAAPAAAH
jgi:mono/diheme cytochrome c family protein